MTLRRKTRTLIRAWWLVAPMLLVLAAVAAYPLYRSIYFSFTDAKLDLIDQAQWIGFENYYSATGGVLRDPEWWNAVSNTLFFTVCSVVLETLLGLIVALCLHRKFKGRGIFRSIILVPWAVPTVVSAKMWNWILNDQFGIANDFLMKIGVLSEPIAWTSNPHTVMPMIIFIDVWKTTPFMALLILAGLQLVPDHIYQAAKVDGVSSLRLFFRVILPCIAPSISVAVIFRSLDALRVFDLIYVLTPSNPLTNSMSVFTRQNLFDFDQFAYGSAASSLLFLIICLLTISYLFLNRKNFDAY